MVRIRLPPAQSQSLERDGKLDPTSNSADSSAKLFSPDSDAIATRALNSALCCFLFTPTSHVLWTGQPLAYPAVQKSGAAAHDASVGREHKQA